MRKLRTAREIIGRWAEHYNQERLHAALQCLPPAEYLHGACEARLQERCEKLERGRKRRGCESIHRERLQQTA